MKRSSANKVLVRLSIGAAACIWLSTSPVSAAEVYSAKPTNYASLLRRLRPGDTLSLIAGKYPRLTVAGLHGTASAWITITGPSSSPPAVIVGAACCNTIEILNSSFVSIENLTIDSRGIDGPFGVSAKDGFHNHTHDIRIQNDRFIGQGGSQMTVAISTKTPTWGWIIRNNRITGAGTGIYLGDSDGTMPFVAGLIENNVIENTIGYNLQIKWQRDRPMVDGMPSSPSVTIIRNNVFAFAGKGQPGVPAPHGKMIRAEPNLLVGGFPGSGAGSTDLYEVYGNLFIGNLHESLLQASGRVSIHDNVFVGGDETAVALQNHDLPLKLAHVYNNTIYSKNRGIRFGSPARVEAAVIGNLIFAAQPIEGPVQEVSENVVNTPSRAGEYVTAPSFDAEAMNFYPLAGKCEGGPLDLQRFASEHDYALDFNGATKDLPGKGIVFRGAYAGAGVNPGWQLQVAQKSTRNPAALPEPLELTPSSAKPGESGAFLIVLHAPKGTEITGMQWELRSGEEVTIEPADTVAGSAAVSAEKSLTCLKIPAAGRGEGEKCLLAGGSKTIPDGPIAVVRYRIARHARSGQSKVHVDKILTVSPDLKHADLAGAEGIVTIQ